MGSHFSNASIVKVYPEDYILIYFDRINKDRPFVQILRRKTKFLKFKRKSTTYYNITFVAT